VTTPQKTLPPARGTGLLRALGELVLVELLSFYLLFAGWTSRRIFKGPRPPEELVKNDRKQLYVFWHNRIFYFTYLYRHLGIAVPISLHRDGRLIARVARRLGHRVIDGSTSKGGANALSGLISTLSAGRSAAVTPDGPRGPKYSMKENGLFYAAFKTGTPIMAAAWYAKNVVEFKSWDNFILPLPFTTFYVAMSDELYVKSEAEIPAAKEELKRRLDSVTEETERHFKPGS
jgi:lysophospholipid acyltransferase (LPLAT)-like uncharacterized protein